MKSEVAEASSSRRTAILDVAIRVFLRYGFKKTSMDDLARAADLSRQGLYLHFANKEEVFKESVLHFVAQTRAASRAALANDKLSLEDRLLAAFEAVHTHSLGETETQHSAEILEAATQFLGPLVRQIDEAIVEDVAQTLRAAGLVAVWKDVGVSAKDLADELCSVSHGLKHRVSSVDEYRDSMRKAIRMTCRRRG
jgi:AcrR family transcriptional regulator